MAPTRRHPDLPETIRRGTCPHEAVHVAFRDAMSFHDHRGSVIIVIGAGVTWYLLPGKLDTVEEMSAH